MRNAYYDKSWIEAEDGSFMGVCLGYDHCAEHEWGIKPLLAIFEIGTNVSEGLEARQIQSVPDDFVYFLQKKKSVTLKGKRKTLDVAILYVGRIRRWAAKSETPEKVVSEQLFASLPPSFSLVKEPIEERDTLTTAWCDADFRITVVGKENCERLRQLHEAIMTKDATISLAGRRNPFGGNGLCVVIASKVSQDQRQSILDKDRAYARLLKAAQDTGVAAALEKAGKRYHALSPAWVDKEKEEGIQFFLNPEGQRDNNHGWFSPEELLAWTRGEGPIPKKAKEQA